MRSQGCSEFRQFTKPRWEEFFGATLRAEGYIIIVYQLTQPRFFSRPMASVPSLRELVNNDLCCAQWRSETDHVGRLGCTFPATSSCVFCKSGFNATTQAALFRLCVPVALKTSDNNRKKPLYVSIEPQYVSSLQSVPLDGSEVTQACVSDLLAYSQWCSLSADIIRASVPPQRTSRGGRPEGHYKH